MCWCPFQSFSIRCLFSCWSIMKWGNVSDLSYSLCLCEFQFQNDINLHLVGQTDKSWTLFAAYTLSLSVFASCAKPVACGWFFLSWTLFTDCVLFRVIRTSLLQPPRWPTRSPSLVSRSCPPASTSTSTSTSPASEPGSRLPRLHKLHQPAFPNGTHRMKMFPHSGTDLLINQRNLSVTDTQSQHSHSRSPTLYTPAASLLHYLLLSLRGAFWQLYRLKVV